jgi:hypothetical protein
MNLLVDQLIRIIQNSTAVKSTKIVNVDESPSGHLELKIRCQLKKKYKVQVWIHQTDTYFHYSYQLFTTYPILRWDNAPHYPNISSAPHHFHDEENRVTNSLLSGDVLQDIHIMLKEVITYIENN